jgi:catechol 2,3-dioxygenase-like lactoylglutathione lyase family enzyme
MKILEFFHLIHVVDDEDEVDAFYRDLFAPQPVVEKHFSEVEKRWASLGMVSDLMLEVIEPSADPADADVPLPKFRRRHGQHFHSLAWYVDSVDVKAWFDRFQAAGIRVARPGGGVFGAAERDPGNTIFTYPKDTFGQIELEGKDPHWADRDARFSPAWTLGPWLDGPLGIERLSHMTTMVRDVGAAARLYRDVLDGVVFHQASDGAARSVFVLVGTDTVIELAQPLSEGSLLARDLAAHGEMPHSATFKVRDLDAVERHVDKLGIAVHERSPGSVVLDPASCYGAVWAFTDRELPGDPRAGRG